MPDLIFTVPGEPVPKARAGRQGRKSYTPERTRLAEEAVGIYALAAFQDSQLMMRDSVGHYGLKLKFYIKAKRRRDLDNLAKTVMDGMKAILWLDDSQVHILVAGKIPVTDNPRTEVSIWRME